MYEVIDGHTVMSVNDWLRCGLTMDQFKKDSKRGLLDIYRRSTGGNTLIDVLSIRRPERRRKIELEMGKLPKDGLSKVPSIFTVVTDTDAIAYYTQYTDERGLRLSDDTQHLYANGAAVLNTLIAARRQMIESNLKIGKKVNMAKMYESFSRFAEEQTEFRNALPRNARRLREKMEEYGNGGGRDYGCLVKRNAVSGGTSGAAKISEKAGQWLVARFATPINKVTMEQLYEEYNAIAPVRGWKAVETVDTIRNYMNRPEIKPLWYGMRYGELKSKEKRTRLAAEWVLSALFGTMEAGRGRFIMVGNRIAKKSILTMITERPGVHHTVVNILDRNGKPTWSENYTPDEVAEMRSMMGERNFQKEYMNNPMTEGAVFRPEQITYGKILPLKDYKMLVCYTDPSFKNSTTADYKATMLVGRTPDGHFHLLKAYAAQTSVSEMIQWHYAIEEYVAGRVPVMYYMESNFMQDLMLDEFTKAGNERGLHIPIRGDARKKPDKFARIEAMQPLFERGLVLFNEKEKDTPGMIALVDQLLLFERGSRAHDDAPDALESAIWMLSQRTRTSTARFVSMPRNSRKW